MRLDRRRFLRNVGVAAAALPFLRGLEARAEGAAPPKRCVVWFTPNGVPHRDWFPTGGEHDFQLGTVLAPLEPFRNKLLIFGAQKPLGTNIRELRGISIKSSEDTTSGGHGMGMLLTGRPVATYEGTSWASGISMDQYLAEKLGQKTRLASVELGVRQQGSTGTGNRMSYRGAGLPVPPENNPAAAFDRLFGDLDPAMAAERERRILRKKSILDLVRGDFTDLRRELGRDAQLRLDAHLEVIRNIEQRLDIEVSASAACVPPTLSPLPEKNSWDEYTNMPRIGELQMDILAMAFACDLTRIGSIMWNWGSSNARFPFLGINEWHHALSHEPWSNEDARQKLVQIHRWYNEQLAAFMTRLSKIPEADGSTVLDNTVILCVNEMSEGMFHTHQNMPFMIAGDARGHFRTGRYIQVGDLPHNDLLVSVIQAMGLPDVTFGDPRFCNGPIPGLT